jgi:hypothetical protein
VDLALTCAQAKDPYDRCSSYVDEGCPPMDSRRKYYEIKKRCYICVFSALLDAEYAGELQYDSAGKYFLFVQLEIWSFSCPTTPLIV